MKDTIEKRTVGYGLSLLISMLSLLWFIKTENALFPLLGIMVIALLKAVYLFITDEHANLP